MSYLNYHYKTTNDCWAITEKSKQEGLRTYLFLKKSLDLWGLSLYPWNFWTHQSFLYPWNFCKIVFHPLITPGNCTSFSVDPKNFNMTFLQYPRKFDVLKPTPPCPCLEFSLSIYIYVYKYAYIYIHTYTYIYKYI